MGGTARRLGRSFNGLWISTGAANLADGIALFTLPLLAIDIAVSDGGVAVVTAFLFLAWPAFGLHAGWLVDRLDRRRLLASVNVARAGVLLVLTAAYVTDTLSLPLILAAAFVLGAGETLVDTALTSTVPLLVDSTHRARANARIEATINLTHQMAGPPLAGILAGITLAAATGAGAVLYAAALAGLTVMVVRRKPSDAAEQVHQRGVLAGLRYLWRHPVLRPVTLFTAAMNVVWAAAMALLVVYAVRTLGLSRAEFGFMLTAMAVGGLAAATLLEPLRRRVGTTTLLVADCVGTVLLVAPAATGAGVWPVAAGAVVAGAGASIWRILVATIRQNLTPSDLLGRVYAASRVISWGALPVGAGIAAAGAELWGVRAVFAAGTVVAVATLAGFVAFASRTDLSAAAAGVPVA